MSKLIFVGGLPTEVVEIPTARNYGELLSIKQLKGDPHWDERAGESEECDCHVHYRGVVWSQVMSDGVPHAERELASIP